MTTLKEKKLLNDAVTGETKRCLAIVMRLWEAMKTVESPEDMLFGPPETAITEIIKNSPYIEFHPKLLKRIPK
jgi:hypothetical protein